MAAFAHRSFRLWFFGQIVSQVGTWMGNMAQGWLVYELTGSAFLMGIVQTCSSLPMLFFTLWGGVVADRFPKRRILLVTQAIMMLLAFALATLAAGSWIRYWHVLLIAILSGTVMAFDMPARQTMVIDLAGEENLMNALALNSTVFNGARIVGPMLAGALLPVIQVSGCFLLNGASFLAVLISLLMMRHAENPTLDGTESPWRHVAAGLQYVRGRPAILLLFTQLTLLGVFGWNYMVLMPLFAGEVLKVGERGYGLLLAANGFGALIASLAMASGAGAPRPRRVFLGVLIFAVAQGLFAASRFLPLSLLCMAVTGASMITFFTTANTLVQTTTPEALRGRVMGIYTLTFNGTFPLGSLQAGLLAGRFGAPTAVGISAAVCALSAGIALLLMRRVGEQLDARRQPM